MRYRTNRGFSLLEVLIALLIFSLGLLGLASLMVLSVKTNHSAYLRTQASFLAEGMADRIRANTGQTNSYIGDYDASTVGTDSCQAATCSPAQLVTRDRAVWSQQLVDFLPNSSATIACDGDIIGTPATSGAATYNGLCTLTITWTESNLGVAQDATSRLADQTFAWVFQP